MRTPRPAAGSRQPVERLRASPGRTSSRGARTSSRPLSYATWLGDTVGRRSARRSSRRSPARARRREWRRRAGGPDSRFRPSFRDDAGRAWRRGRKRQPIQKIGADFGVPLDLLVFLRRQRRTFREQVVRNRKLARRHEKGPRPRSCAATRFPQVRAAMPAPWRTVALVWRAQTWPCPGSLRSAPAGEARST